MSMLQTIAPPAYPPHDRDPVVNPHHTYASVTDEIAGVVQQPTGSTWRFGFALAFLLLMLLNLAITWLFIRGVGIWGINIPVGWGYAIVNFVWWIGIGHAGTFISAFLLLLRQQWRTSINRFAEAMTLFAVACAGMFPLLHLGRPYFFYWLLPYPNVMLLWPQFRSPLVWDVFAVSTYFTVSLIFWYVGLIPDLATMRDRPGRKFPRYLFGFFALGWNGSARHWARYQKAYLLLAGLAAPLVISVHSVVGMDFAGGIVPGWHSAIQSPYFVGGAIFSGFAMVLTLAIPLRHFYHLEDLITPRHLDNCAKLMLVTGTIVAYGYYMEAFMGWYSGSVYDAGTMQDRYSGSYSPLFWTLIFCNVVVPQSTLWIPRIRRNPALLFIISLIVNCGMWLERFIIVIQSLHHDYLPSGWEIYKPTRWDWATLLGSLGLFFVLFLLFARLVPVIAVAEMRELVRHHGDASNH